MKTDTFPLNYFKTIWSPKKIIEKRQSLNWFQLLFLLIFLNALMIVPVSLNYTRIDSYSLENTFPESFQMLDKSVVSELSKASIKNGEMTIDEFEINNEQGAIMGGISSDRAELALQEEENTILFLEDELVIKETNQSASHVPYTKDFTLEGIESTDQLKEAVSQQWFIKNQSFLIAVLSFILFVLLLAELVFLIFGAAFFLYISSKNKPLLKSSYKESVSVVMYAAGAPTIAAMLVGLIDFNIITMVTVQSIGMIGFIWVIYYHNRISEIKAQKEMSKQVQY
ncbi:MAG: DUF1189 family protein [Desemzia incerta]|uniref:DUF1189 family protein n=1 Tax=Desemzia incerta TaxID=82801 RepID=UPI0033163378